MKNLIILLAALGMLSCATGSPEKNFAATYSDAYKKGFQDGFEKASSLKQPPPASTPAPNYGYDYYGGYKDYNYDNYNYNTANQKGTVNYAVQTNNLASVKELVEKQSADVNAMDASGYSPLQIASRLGYIDIINYLITKGANVNFVSSDSYNPLKEAITYKKFAAAEILISKGADINFVDSSGYAIIYYAAQSGNKKIVEMVLEKGASPVSTGSTGFGPLLASVSMGFEDIAALLLEKGSNPDEIDNYTGFTALMYAVRNNKPKLVEMLAGKTTNINFTEKNGKTALHLAVEYNRLDMVKVLVKAGSSPDIKDNNGASPAETADKRGLKDISDFLKSTKKI